MTRARASFDSLRREIDRLFPATSREAALLGQPLAELAGMLAESAAPEAGPALDAFEDLLEALMYAAGWPAPNRPGERGSTP